MIRVVSIVVFVGVVWFGACAQPGTGERSSGPESAETWAVPDTSGTGDEADGSVDAGGPDEFAEICEKIDSYDERRGEVDEAASGPRTEPAAKYDGFADESQQVVLHTLDESVATKSDWAPLLVRKGGHFEYSVRGRVGVHPSEISIPGEISPLQELVDILEACEVDRGLFHSLGGPIVAGEDLQLFECTPGMPSLRQNVESEGDAVPENLQAVWRVDDVLVKCSYPDMHVEFVADGSSPPPEKFPKADDVADAEFVPDRIASWLSEVLKHDKEWLRKIKVEQNWDPWEERPYDYLTLVKRTFLLVPIDRAWRQDRTVLHSYHSRCNTSGCDYMDNVEWLRPHFDRHWKYRFRDEPE